VAHEGGGGFHNNGAIYHWNKTLIEGLDIADPKVRMLDQSRIGPVLTAIPADIKGGPPVTVLFTQNTNPVQVAPEQRKVKAGFAREDLFVCVHEQFMTATAKMADVVLPATMFLEHDDVYQAGGQQSILLGPKLVEAPGECWSNHDVICALAKRVGAEHRGFTMTRARSSTGRCRIQAGAPLPSSKRRSGSTRSPSSIRRTMSPASAMRTRSSASSRIGRVCQPGAATTGGSAATCRRCPTTGT
jgi:anaerobic selenocysteine-containing dehydrogenase